MDDFSYRPGYLQKTFVGTTLSVLLRLAIVGYFTWSLLKLIAGESGYYLPTILSSIDSLEAQGAIKLSEVNNDMFVFHVIKKDKIVGTDINKPLTTPEIQKYINITYAEMSIDRTKPDIASRMKRVNYQVRQCTEEDFNKDEETRRIFRSFLGEYLVCPDISSQATPTFYGTPQSVQSRHIDINFEKCDATVPGNTCADTGDALNYLQDIIVETYAVSKELDPLAFTGSK